MTTSIIILTLLGILFGYFFIKPNEEEEREKREVEKRFEDELIYDPFTGTKLTLEEAEKGISIDKLSEERRVKSSEEIELNFDDDGKEVEYFLNDLAENGFLSVKSVDPIITLLEKTDCINGYSDYMISDLYQYESSSFIGVIQVAFTTINGKFNGEFLERQLFAIFPSHADISSLNNIDAYNVESINDIIFIKSSRKVQRSEGLELINFIRNSSKTS